MRFTDTVFLTKRPGGLEERRGSLRFPFGEEVAYRFFQGREVVSGSGRAVNMGSGGLLFATRDLLPVGQKVEVTVNWPALLDGACRLKLVASGRVLRADTRGTAVRIDHYEFHTRASGVLDHGGVRDVISRECDEACAVS